VIDIVVSDTEPVAGALEAGMWERSHAVKTWDRIDAAKGKALRIWNGCRYVESPSGSWALHASDLTNENGVLRGRLSFVASGCA